VYADVKVHRPLSDTDAALASANLVIQVAELVVNGAVIAVAELATAAAGGLVTHIVLGALFAWALVRAPAQLA